MLKWNLRNISEVVDWILLDQDKVRCQLFVNTGMNILVTQRRWMYWPSDY